MQAVPSFTPCRQHIPFAFAVESLLEQGSGTLNEDALLVQSDIYGVFDGASSLCGHTFSGKSGAWLAANIARDIFAEHTGTLVDVAVAANRAVSDAMAMRAVDLDDPLQRWSASAAVVRVCDEGLEFVQVGDALIVCIYADGSFSLPAPYMNHDEGTLLLWKSLVQSGIDDVRSAVQPRIEQVRRQMNKTYGVLNGEPAFGDFLVSGRIATENLAHVLLFTDGLHIPCPDPSCKDDFSALVAQYLHSGLEGLHRYVRLQEKHDPECRMYPRFKQHDDIAAIAFSF